MHAANSACNALSHLEWVNGVFGQYALHKLAYHPIKGETGLTAQVMVRCITKVADAYKLDKWRKRTFKLDGAAVYECKGR
jgi:putative transposase